jgi:hypothetical protein
LDAMYADIRKDYDGEILIGEDLLRVLD